VIDHTPLQIVLGMLTGWLARREREAVAYLIEENRLLRQQLSGHRLRLTDDGADDWPRGRGRIGWAVRSCGRSRRSPRPIPCCGGIDS
jgi:hypothetical protein